MSVAIFTVNKEYWEGFELIDEDIEFIYTHLLELEIPLSPDEILTGLIADRLEREKSQAEDQQKGAGVIYLPKEEYAVGDKVIFPTLNFQAAEVKTVRPANSLGEEKFSVIEVEFEGGEVREFAAGLEDHFLNIPPELDATDPMMNPAIVLRDFGKHLEGALVEELQTHDDFVHIAGRWFPSALLMDVNAGHLNLAEAILDMSGGGPLPTSELVDQVGLPEGDNAKLSEFSLDLALQEDERFDEVGPEGEIAWYLKRLEPDDVLTPPIYLRYTEIDYDRADLDEQMLAFEKQADDELSSLSQEDFEDEALEETDVTLIFPHWRAGTLPLSARIQHLFPTAYEAPRILFTLVDGNTGEKFPGWVVRLDKYISGLREWYLSRGVMPGTKLHLRKGENPGEVILTVDSHRSNKEWVRTALIGSDGGVVYAMLKQQVSTAFEDRMMVYMPGETQPLDETWKAREKSNQPFEQVVADCLRELAKLNPQMHVHAEELYSAVNVVYRCPPAPLLALLTSRTWFTHVGDMHFRFDDSQ